MTEETEILMARMVAGEMDSSSQKRWDLLCKKNPQLLVEAGQLKASHARMVEILKQSEDRAREQAPIVPPTYILTQLESARKHVFIETGATRGRFLDRIAQWLKSGVHFPIVLQATAVATILLCAAWWLMQKPPSGSLTLATTPPIFKSAVVSPGLPLASPSLETSFVDPSLLWISLDTRPVEISILDASGRPLLQSTFLRSPVSWSELSKNSNLKTLLPGTTYLLRLRQEAMVSEQVVHVRSDAKPLSAWVGKGEGLKLAQTWLAEGRPGDSLILLSALRDVKHINLEELNQIRMKALQAALKINASTSALPKLLNSGSSPQ